ncbi:hypothetical protein AAEP93_006292 [Penicillium crustosum]
MLVAIATLVVTLVSSAYTGGIEEIEEQFHIGSELATLGVSFFVLGFAIGPLLWAPLSELFGRQIFFSVTYCALTVFNAGAAGAQNSGTLIALRFFAGAFGSSPLTNAGGLIADIFPSKQRGIAVSIFAAAPFLRPVLGPIIGGFLGFLAACSGAVWIICTLMIPETYAPVLLRRRADKLTKITGNVYRSKIEIDQGWNQGIGGLAFLGIAVGMLVATVYFVFDNKRYIQVEEAHDSFAPPEARLRPCLIASVAILIGLFCLAAGVPFGFGMVLVFLSIINYLIDTYTIFAASVLAANSVLRSLFGAAFPLFTTYIYNKLGIHWASYVPAFLALAYVPFPFLLFKYSPTIRKGCRFAAQSDAFIRKIQEQTKASSKIEEEKEQERISLRSFHHFGPRATQLIKTTSTTLALSARESSKFVATTSAPNTPFP